MTNPYPEYRHVNKRWLQEIPAEWSTTRLRYLCDITTGSGDTINAEPDGDYPFFVRSPVALRAVTYDNEGEAILTVGDGAVGEVFHYIRSGRFLAHQRVYVLKNFRNVHSRFLFLYFSSMFRLMAQDGSARTTVDSVRRWMLTDMPVALPPLHQQRAIAEYLDREITSIDRLIEEQRRLIEMLVERRDAAWAARIETAHRLGRPTSIRRVIDSITDGPFGSSLTSAHYSDEGARVIRLGNIGLDEFKDKDAAFIPLDYARELAVHAVETGDVVVAGLGDDKMPLGRAAVVPSLGPAIVKADCYRLRPNTRVSADYLAWVLSGPQMRSQIMLLARGSTRARLNTKVMQQVEIPLPDRDVQNDLVAQSHAETAKIDSLIGETERFIELSKERRAALITAAVTGLIDVRSVA